MTIITWHFLFQPANISILKSKVKYGTEVRPVSRTIHMLRQLVPVTMGIVVS